MQNQRLLYSDSKRVRAGSINKENNIKLFNDSYPVDSLDLGKKPSTELRFDYDNNTRIPNRNIKTVTEQFTFSKPLEKSPLRKNINLQEVARMLPTKSNQMSHQYDPIRKNSLASSQQQIQSYTNKLLQNNQSYQDQIFQLKQQNAKTRSELEKSIAQNIKFRMTAQKKQEEIKQKYNQQISQLVKQLKQILQAKQEMEFEYNKYIQQLMEDHSKQLQGREESFSKTQEFFKEKLSNLKGHLSLNKQEKEKQYFEASECKLRLMKQIDELNYSIQKQRIDKREFQKSNQEMIKIIKNLEIELKQAKQVMEKAQLEVFKIQKDKNQIIIELKSQNKSLCEGVKDLQNKISQLDRSLSKKENDFTKLQYEILSTKKQLDQKTKSFLQKNLQLEQLKTFKKQLEDQNIKLSQTLVHQKSNFQNLVQQLQASINSLTSKLQQTEAHLKDSEKQNNHLNSQLQVIKKEKIDLIEETSKLEELNKKYKKDNIQFLEQLEFLSLENKSLKEDKVLKDNHMRTLQQMCEQLQKTRGKNKQPQIQKLRFFEQSERLQAAKIKQKNNEIAQTQRLLRNKFQTQIQRLKDQNLELKTEIQHIVRDYEQKLSQKQRKWQNRVQNIEKDLENLVKVGHPIRNVNQKDETQYRPIDRGIQSAQNQRYFTTRNEGRSPYITKNLVQQSPRQRQQVRPDILASLTRRDAIRNKYQSMNAASPQRSDYLSRNVQGFEPSNEENGFKRKDAKYYDQIERRLNEFSNSRKINY